jgi:hypothetical protein
MRNHAKHYINSCFPLNNVGGQDSVMTREARLNPNKEIVCIAPDTEEVKNGNIQYRTADPLAAGKEDRWDLWFGVGLCQLTFPEAYISPSAQATAVHAMLEADENRPSAHKIGTLERLLEYVDLYAPEWTQGRNFTQRFERQLLEIPQGSILNWQSFFMEPAINDYADTLRDKGIKQTFHLHESLPESLHLSSWGKSFLNAITRVDAVYLHTDEFIRRLELQIEAGREQGWISCSRTPEIRRFDLGIDADLIQHGLTRINKGNYQQSIPNWAGLSVNQQDFISEVFRSQETIPHRFMCVDRIDPVKGVDVVLDGIDTFLSERLSGGMSYHELRDSFRFFFLQKAGNATEGNPYNTAARYNKYTEEVFQRVQQKYPGIIHRGDPLGGEHRIAVFPLMRGCHGITGGTTEGLSLSIMENAKANENLDTSFICGAGAGFAMQVKEHSRERLAEFPAPGNPEAFSKSLNRIVDTQAKSPGTLGQNKHKIVRHEIDSRRDSVIVD